MSDRSSLAVRLARRVGRTLARGYPAALGNHVQIARFIDDAADDAWRQHGWIGVISVMSSLARDVIRVRLRGAQFAIADPTPPHTPPRNTRSHLMDQFAQDVRQALRRLAHAPGFTTVALLTLALGIGMTTAVFTVVDQSMLRPFSYPNTDRMMLVNETGSDGQRVSASWPNFQDWRAQSDVFESFGIYRGAIVTLTGSGDPERVSGSYVSSAIFDVTGLHAIAGRTFGPADDEPTVARIVVISDRLWHTHFGGRADILGQTVTMNDRPTTIVGVMPATMRFPSRTTDVWLPFGLLVSTLPSDRGNHPGLAAIGRLKPGVTVERAGSVMATIAKRLSDAYPTSNHDHQLIVTPYDESIVQSIRPTFRILLGAVGLVLLIACANLASLMVARAEARRRELAICAALGATRRRLTQQLLVEAGVLAVVGGALGVALAYAAVRLFVASQPTTIPRIDLVGVDLRVLVFAALTSIASGLLFGLAPALRGSRLNLRDAVQGSRDGVGPHSRRLRSALVMGEIALALMLLVGAGLLGRSLERLASIDLGFSPSHVVTMQLALPPTSYAATEKWTGFYRSALDRLRGLPGVETVGFSTSLPLAGDAAESGLMHEGDPAPTPERPGAECQFQAITPDYFTAMGITLVRGRGFTERDASTGVPVAIVDETFATHFAGTRDPIGQRIAFEFRGTTLEDPQPIWREVVGVVRHVKTYGLTGEPPNVQVFAPYTQLPFWFEGRSPSMSLAVRTTVDPQLLVAAVRHVITALDSRIPVYGVQTMDQAISQTIEQPRLAAALFSSFAGLALILAIVGVYGVLSYAVAQRSHEIGLRMALGAQRADIAGVVARHAIVLVGTGLAIGIAGAIGLSKFLSTLLFEVSPTDPFVLAGVAATLVITAAIATFVPARRAASVDPLVALRSD